MNQSARHAHRGSSVRSEPNFAKNVKQESMPKKKARRSAAVAVIMIRKRERNCGPEEEVPGVENASGNSIA